MSANIDFLKIEEAALQSLQKGSSSSVSMLYQIAQRYNFRGYRISRPFVYEERRGGTTAALGPVELRIVNCSL